MDKRLDKDVLGRYLSGKYTACDYRQVKKWFTDPYLSLQLDTLILDNWQEFEEQGSPKDLNFILQKVQSRIYLDEKKRAKTLWHYYRQIAAILLLPVLLFSSYVLIDDAHTSTETAWAEIHSPLGIRTRFSLPDGTSGWLNCGSILQYPVDFSDRKVKIAGEAFFDVSNKKNKKFVVETPSLSVTVLGTKFNVAAYPDDNFVEVVLEEGSVRLDGNSVRFSETLAINQRFMLYNGQEHGAKTIVNAELYSSWKDGKQVFHDQPLSQVLKRMERFYNVRFIIEDEQLKNYIYKATFKDETLDEMLKLLAWSAPIDYEIKNRTMADDGSYLIKTIIIRER